MTRRSFFAAIAGVAAAAPTIQVARPDPLLDEIARLTRKTDALLAFQRQVFRPMIRPEELAAYQAHVTAELRRRRPRVQ